MNNKKLFVGNLTYSVREGQLRGLFSRYGEVVSVNVIEKKGYGFVEMKTPEEAKNAREALNETEFEGRNLLIDGIRPPLKPKRKPSGIGTSGHGGGSSSRSGYKSGRSGDGYRGKNPRPQGGQHSARSGHGSKPGGSGDGYRGKNPRPQGGERSSRPGSGPKRGSSMPPRRNTGGRPRR